MTRGQFVDAQRNEDGSWTVNRASNLSEEEFRLRFIEVPSNLPGKEFVDPRGKIEILRYNDYVKVIDHEESLEAQEDSLEKALDKLDLKRNTKSFLYEAAFYVSRGAKPRVFGTTQDFTLEELRPLLNSSSYPGTYPYIIETSREGEGKFLEFGYVSEPWIVDVLVYIEGAPDKIQTALNGLLCGYEPAAIQSLLSDGLGARKRSKGNILVRKIK